jgi:hypothetical protein
MRVAIIVVAVALASTPALASPSCMTQSEARAKFPKSHLWWHGSDRCWDATAPNRHRLAQRNKSRETKRASRQAQDEREEVEEKKPSRAASQPKWREAMSRARAEDLVGVTGSAQAEVNFAPSMAPAPPRINFWDRWVDVAQRLPPIEDKADPADLAADARVGEPLVTPVRVMLTLLLLLLALGAFELMVRRPARS